MLLFFVGHVKKNQWNGPRSSNLPCRIKRLGHTLWVQADDPLNTICNLRCISRYKNQRQKTDSSNKHKHLCSEFGVQPKLHESLDYESSPHEKRAENSAIYWNKKFLIVHIVWCSCTPPVWWFTDAVMTVWPSHSHRCLIQLIFSQVVSDLIINWCSFIFEWPLPSRRANCKIIECLPTDGWLLLEKNTLVLNIEDYCRRCYIYCSPVVY